MKRIIIKRERLYELVWEQPIYKICEKYHLSENKLKDICKYLDVPIPQKGYWTQYRAGKQPKKEKLLTNNGEDEWIEYINEYEVSRKEELKVDPLANYSIEEQETIKKVISQIDISKKVTKLHPLVLARKSTIDIPQKKLDLYDIRESKEIKERIDFIYHTIFFTIEKLGYEIRENKGKYIAIIKGEEIAFKIREKAKIEYRDLRENERNYYTVYVNGKKKVREVKASGNLELKIDSYGKKDTWKDTPKTSLEKSIGNIIIEFFYCAMKEKKRKQEREQEKREHEEKEFAKMQRGILLRFEELKQLYEIGKKISKINLGLSGSKVRIFVLEDIIEKMVLHIGSFIRIAVNNSKEELDISILATIARNVMECYNTYFYYAERKISDEEVEFRYYIANLHYDNSMIDIIKKLEYAEDNFRTTMLYRGKEIIIEDIKKSEIYQNLSKMEKSQVVNGNQAYINKRQKNSHRILAKNIESAIYNIFSNSTHSYYIGLGTNSMNGSVAHRGYITSTMVLCLATEITLVYAANILSDYLQLRKKLNQYITELEKNFTKEMTSNDKLLNWLEIKKGEYAESFWEILDLNLETEDIIL